MARRINDKLLNTNKPVFLSALLSSHTLTAILWVVSLQSPIKTQITKKWDSFPTNSEDGGCVLTSARIFECVPLSAEPVWGVSFVHTAGVWQSRGIPAGDNWQERRNLRSACSLTPYRCSQSSTDLQKIICFYKTSSRPNDRSARNLMHHCWPKDWGKHITAALKPSDKPENVDYKYK